MRPLLVLPFLALAACATPQEQCVANANRNLRTIEALIRETQGNLARGYAIETRNVLTNERQVCGHNSKGENIYCDIAVSDQQRVPVAVDLEAEQAKLNSLIARRNQMVQAQPSILADCQARYPEG